MNGKENFVQKLGVFWNSYNNTSVLDFLREFSDLTEYGNWYKVEAITTFQNLIILFP